VGRTFLSAFRRPYSAGRKWVAKNSCGGVPSARDRQECLSHQKIIRNIFKPTDGCPWAFFKMEMRDELRERKCLVVVASIALLAVSSTSIRRAWADEAKKDGSEEV